MWTFFCCASRLSFSFSIFAGSFTKASQACSPPGNTLPAQSPQKSKLMTSTWSPEKMDKNKGQGQHRNILNKGFEAENANLGLYQWHTSFPNQVIERLEPKPSSGDSLLPNDWWICSVLRNVYVVFVFRDYKTVFIFHTMQSAPIFSYEWHMQLYRIRWKFLKVHKHPDAWHLQETFLKQRADYKQYQNISTNINKNIY